MNVNDELEKFRQGKAQEFFTQELPNRLKGFKAALDGTPEEIKKKLDEQEEIYILNFWNKLDELEEQKKKTLELARDAADIHCEDEEKPLASEIIADLNEHMEKLRNQREILRMQTDIINLVLKVNDYEYLKTLQNHVRVACNQQNKKQEV
jgi:Zn-dependent oligopeptidase